MEEIVNPETWAGENTSEKFEVSKEQFEKLQEIERNKTIALKKEREESQTLKSELEELRKFKAELAEKEMKKKWQYEELLSEKEKIIAELKEKASKFDEFQTQKQKEIETTLNELLLSIPENIIEENKDFIEELSDEKKIKFLERLKPKKETFDPQTKDGAKNPNNLWDIEIEQAKNKWFDSFLSTMIKNNIK